MIASVREAARGRFWAGLGGARHSELTALPDWQARLDASSCYVITAQD